MRPMIRTPEEFPRALTQKIEQNGGKDIVAKKLGVTTGAINWWLQGTIPNGPNREKILKVLNIKLLPYEKLTDEEAVAVNNMVNEQMAIDLEGLVDEPMKTKGSSRWINLYKTPNPGVYKGTLDSLQFVLVKQKFEDRADEVPFVMVMNVRGE